MEFYIRFWEVLGQDLVDVVNTCYASGSLSLSQRGIISLVFKRGDRLDARNWRPITLLNADYKLASWVLAGRLLKVIHVVVSKDQTCGVAGRFIGENIALLRDIVDYTSFSNVHATVLSLDQEKAFDRVDWSFMLATLSKMGFGPSFLHWVCLFYTGVHSCVNVNGYLSSFFVLSHGVRQGCPLSPMLYVLVSEVLAVNIRANPRITGLSIPGSQTPLAAQFNPNNNYGYKNNRSQQPSRQRNIPYGFSRQRTSTSRPSYSRRGTRARPAEVSTMKEVILLPHPTTRKVPKFHHKLRLQQCGLISDGCAIERAWNESEVRRFLSSLFFEKLKDKHGEPVR